jgi:NAD(P)-dependent dehydrogenase (short-subunit alcohol dehydrogenase family)
VSEKLCVVTGTSSGIGRAVAERLLEQRWQVVGVARRVAPLHDQAYHHVTLDLADLEALERYFREDFAQEFPADRYRRVGLVNNAGVLDPVHPLLRLSTAELQRGFAINSVAPLWLMGFFLGHCAHTPLRVVNVSSGAAQARTRCGRSRRPRPAGPRPAPARGPRQGPRGSGSSRAPAGRAAHRRSWGAPVQLGCGRWQLAGFPTCSSKDGDAERVDHPDQISLP